MFLNVARPLVAFTLAAAALVSVPAHTNAAPKLEEVASFPDQQVTGVTVSTTGRIFVNFPYWSGDHTTSVAEVLSDGTTKPYPDAAWNAKEGDVRKRFICVQSVVVDEEDNLWALDAAAPMLDKVVENSPKLVKIDLKTDQVVQTIPFDKTVAPEKSYLNDVRFDGKNGHAYITESGVGSLVIVDLKAGTARRVLERDPRTKAELDKQIIVDGFTLVEPKTGAAPQFHADGIAFDAQKGLLYFHALTGRLLYRIKTSDLLNTTLTDKELGARIETVAETVAPDGMLEDKKGRIVLAALEKNGIYRYDPTSKKQEVLIEDQRLQWPDTMSWGPDGALYVTTSQIHRMPKFHGGKSARTEPYRLYKMMVPE